MYKIIRENISEEEKMKILNSINEFITIGVERKKKSDLKNGRSDFEEFSN